jgi:hypothetical protein
VVGVIEVTTVSPLNDDGNVNEATPGANTGIWSAGVTILPDKG